MDNKKLDSIKKIVQLFSKKPGSRQDSDLQSISRLISNNKFLCQISKEQKSNTIINQVANVLTIEIYQPGECVINYGETGSKFYIILYGQLSVLIPTISNRSGSSSQIRESICKRSIQQENEIKQTTKIERKNIKLLKALEAPGISINRQDSLKLDRNYMVRMGIVEEMKEVSILKDGDSFGELALLSEKPRAATVESKDICVLAVLSKQDFKKILSQEADKSLKEKVNFLFKLPIFSGYTKQSVQKLSYYFQEQVYNKGSYVYKENSIPDKIYFIYRGEFKLFQTRSKLKRKIIDFPSGILQTERSMLKIKNAREVEETFQLQVAIKGKNELFGYEEYLNSFSSRIQSCVSMSHLGVLYGITIEVLNI
jgi:CRP-like cAMP-binding protein